MTYVTRYKNRQEAAELLAAKLSAHRGPHTLVLGIPKGGVETAHYLARALQAELSVLVAKKLTDPRNPEYVLGAWAEEDERYLEQDRIIPRTVLEAAIAKVKKEIKRRVKLYRNGEPLPDMKHRTVILIDDGIATGATMVAALQVCRKHHAGKIIVAAPVNSPNIVAGLYQADELVFLQRPQAFYAVGQFYEDFPQLSDEDVLYFLKKTAQEYQV